MPRLVLHFVPGLLRRFAKDMSGSSNGPLPQGASVPTPPAVDPVVAAADARMEAGVARQLEAIEALLLDHDASLPPLRDLAPGLIGNFDDEELTDHL